MSTTLFNNRRYPDNSKTPPIYFSLYADVSGRNENGVYIKPKFILKNLNPGPYDNWFYNYPIYVNIKISDGNSVIYFPGKNEKKIVTNRTWNSDININFDEKFINCDPSSDRVDVSVTIYSTPNSVETGRPVNWDTTYTTKCFIGKINIIPVGTPDIIFSRDLNDNRVQITCLKGASGNISDAVGVYAEIYVDGKLYTKVNDDNIINISVPLVSKNYEQSVKVNAKTKGSKGDSENKSSTKYYRYYEVPKISNFTIKSNLSSNQMKYQDDISVEYMFSPPLNYDFISMKLFIYKSNKSELKIYVMDLPPVSNKFVITPKNFIDIHGGDEIQLGIKLDYTQTGTNNKYNYDYTSNKLSVKSNSVYVCVNGELKKIKDIYVLKSGVLNKTVDIMKFGGANSV